jgi:hypothetical protein
MARTRDVAALVELDTYPTQFPSTSHFRLCSQEKGDRDIIIIGEKVKQAKP